jgi:hypothetical protein
MSNQESQWILGRNTWEFDHRQRGRQRRDGDRISMAYLISKGYSMAPTSRTPFRPRLTAYSAASGAVTVARDESEL